MIDFLIRMRFSDMYATSCCLEKFNFSGIPQHHLIKLTFDCNISVMNDRWAIMFYCVEIPPGKKKCPNLYPVVYI